jgi:phage-related protein
MPAEFLTELAKPTCYPVEVYELELNITPAQTLYFSYTNTSWDGNDYTRMAVRRSTISQSIEPDKVLECRLSISNITHALRDYIEPDDYITDGRLTIRLLMRDSAGAWITSGGSALSYIIFRGFMESPERINEKTFEITAVWLDQLADLNLPRRTFEAECPWVFADGVHCNYSGGLTTCDRRLNSSDGCDGRARRSDFGGFRVLDQYIRDFFYNSKSKGVVSNNTWLRAGRYISLSNLNDGLTRQQFAEQLTVDPGVTIPVIYGRRNYRGLSIQEFGTHPLRGWNGEFDGDSLNRANLRTVAHQVLSEGEIAQVHKWIQGDLEGNANSRTYVTDPNFANPPCLLKGFWYRTGTVGEDAGGGTIDIDVTPEEQGENVTRPQNQEKYNVNTGAYPDYRLTFSNTAYVSLIWPHLEDSSDVIWDVSGVLIPSYDSAGSVEGYTASDTPPWQILDMYLHPRRGLGRLLSASDINFTSFDTAAAYCDTIIDYASSYTTVTEDITSSLLVPVESAIGFTVGMPVRFNGAIDRAVVNVTDVRTIRIDTAVTLSTGDTVQGRTGRFNSHALFEDPKDANKLIASIYTSCRAFRYYDDGLITMEIEVPQGSSSGSFAETAYASSPYAIQPESFEWSYEFERDVNAVSVEYALNDGSTGTTKKVVKDWDHIQTHRYKEKTITLANIKHQDQAHRIAQFHLDLHRTVGRGGKFRVGPIGMRLRPGDKILVSHSVPDWTNEPCIVTRVDIPGLGERNMYMPQISVRQYDATIYTDSGQKTDSLFPPSSPVYILFLDSFNDRNWTIKLKWGPVNEPGESESPTRWFLYKSFQTFGDPVDPDVEDRMKVFPGSVTEYDYEITEQDLDSMESLWFVIRGVSPTGPSAYSNELEVDPYALISADSENLVYGGDFNDPLDWTEQDPASITAHDPTSNAAGPDDDAAMSNPGQAADGDPTTYAEAVFNNTGPYSEGSYYGWSGAGFTNVLGAVDVRARCEFDQPQVNGHLEFWTNIDGAGYEKLQQPSNGNWYNYYDEVRYVSDSEVVALLRGFYESSQFKASGGGRAQFAYTRFLEYDPPFGIVRANKAFLASNSTASYATLSRPFPGYAPADFVEIMRAGEPHAVRVALSKLGPSGVDGDFEIVLWDENTNTSWTVFHVNDVNNSYTDITENEEHFGTLFIPDTAVTGPCRIVLRTSSTTCIKVDKLGIYRATTIPDWSTTGGEKTTVGNFGEKSANRTTRPVTFGRIYPPTGPTSYKKRSNIS